VKWAACCPSGIGVDVMSMGGGGSFGYPISGQVFES